MIMFYIVIGFQFLFNGISNFVDYFIPRLSLKKDNSAVIQPIAELVYGFKYSYRLLKIPKHIYLTTTWDPNVYYHSVSDWT